MAAAREPPPLSTGALAIAVLTAAGTSLFFWETLPLYPFRLLVTLMHESGHAIAAKLVGGTVESVTISPTEGGLTMSLVPPNLWRHMVVTSAGYLGSSIAGAALLVMSRYLRSGRLILGGLIAWVLAVALIWVPLFPPDAGSGAAKASGFSSTDGLFTLAFIGGIAAVFALVAWVAPVGVRRVLVIWIAVLSCLAALEDIKGLFGYGLAGSSSDADAMARMTWLPAWFWASLWMVLSLGAIWIGLRSLLKEQKGKRPVR